MWLVGSERGHSCSKKLRQTGNIVHYRFVVSNEIIDEFVEEIKQWGIAFKQYPFQLN